MEKAEKVVGEMVMARQLKLFEKMKGAVSEETLHDLMEGIDNWEEGMERLGSGVNWLCFDLEATKRENRWLKKMLEENEKKEDDGLKM
ncbi:MAG: hypothetical protein WC438_02800 [Candidatus Pacearchaeota archaeon]